MGGGDYVHIYKNEQGGFVRGILSYTQEFRVAQNVGLMELWHGLRGG